jgi:hypothetical protein
MADILSFMSSKHDDIKKLFEKACQEAYMQGRRDQEWLSHYRKIEEYSNIDWTDFSLPSKVLWWNIEKLTVKGNGLPYSDSFSYPTKNEVLELINHVDFNLMAWSSVNGGMHFYRLRIITKPDAVHKDGMDVKMWEHCYNFPPSPIPVDDHVDIWIKQEDSRKTTASILRLTFEETETAREYKVHWEIIDDIFKGESAHWLVVKHPQE